MKKIALNLLFSISILPICFSQTNEEMQRQMEQLQRQMQEMTKEWSKQFGGNTFFFDTTIVQPFDFRSLEGMPFFDTTFMEKFEFHPFDGQEFPFDTSMLRGFRLDNLEDAPIQIDTFFFKEFKNFGTEEMPNPFLDESFSKHFGEMMEQMKQYFEQLGAPYGSDAPFSMPHPKLKQKEDPMKKPQPAPTPQKKRKSTAM